MSYFKGKVLHIALQDNLKSDFEKFEQFLEFIENTLQKEQVKVKEMVNEELKGADDEDAAFIASMLYEDIVQVEKDFPRLQRYALFVSLMNMTEYNVFKLYKLTSRIFNIQEKFNEKGGNLVERVLNSLEKHGIPKVNTDLYDNLKRIRNCIAHMEGSLTNRSDVQEIKTFVKKNKNIEIDKEDEIIINTGFIEKQSKEMLKFILNIMEEIFLKYKDLLNAVAKP